MESALGFGGWDYAVAGPSIAAAAYLCVGFIRGALRHRTLCACGHTRTAHGALVPGFGRCCSTMNERLPPGAGRFPFLVSCDCRRFRRAPAPATAPAGSPAPAPHATEARKPPTGRRGLDLGGT
jgi:hypothetical protein